jgi:RNA polymerase-binding transcription factor DksA
VKPTPKPIAKPIAKPAAPKAEMPAPKPEVAIKTPVKKAIQELKKETKTKKPVEIKPVKTSVSTSVRYQPDFTKSVLDKKADVQPEGPLVRYSDTDLQEFRELIQRKLEAAKKELVYLQGLITRKDEMGGDDGDGRYMTMEDGSVSMEREQLSQMASRQITYIDHLEKALMRIENKTYGICRVTGKLIDKARLRAVPHATLSIEAKMGQVKAPQSSGE